MRSFTSGLIVGAALLSLIAACARATPAASDSAATPSIAATVAGVPIELATVDSRAAGTLQRVRQEQYEARAQALDAIIDDDVLAREAAARHLTVDQLIETAVNAKVPAPTPAEIDTFFVQNRGQMMGKPLAEMAPKIAETLTGIGRANGRAAFVRELRKKYAVHVALEPPRFDVSPGDDPARGPANAPVTIVEFSDYQCPYCSRGQATIDAVVKKYGDKVRLVFRDFPLDIHPNAESAAIAADCAKAQGKYWQMNRAMFDNPSRLGDADLVRLAASVGCDTTQFRACFAAPDARAEVAQDVEDGRRYGISGTPTFFVNGVMIVGARELDVFTTAIDRELERLGK